MIPGGYQKHKKITIKKLIKTIFHCINYGKWLRLGNFLISETFNYFHQNNLLDKKDTIICPLCGCSDNSFIHLSNKYEISWNSACPNCNSRSRHRGLIFLYREYLENIKKSKILHFAPEEVLRNEIKNLSHFEYFTTDIEMNNVDFPKEDIQNLSFSNATFDFIMINHVLEHVQDDELAISELSRILKINGVAFITIPGDWKRRHTKFYKKIDYNGHYRDYGLDVTNLFSKYFKIVRKINLFKYDGKKYAIKRIEPAFVCIK